MNEQNNNMNGQFNPNPGMPNPGMPNPGMPNPGMVNPGMPNPGMSNPGMPNPGMPNPGMPNPGMPNPGMPNPGMPNPGMPNPGMVNPQYNGASNQVKKNKLLIPIIIGVVVIVAVIACILIFVVGSGGKKLNCTMSENSMGMVMSTELDMKFKEDTVSEVNAIVSIDLGSYADYKDSMIEELKKQYDSSDKELDIKITSEGNKVVLNAKAKKENFKDLELVESETYDEIKKELEEQGFTCK